MKDEQIQLKTPFIAKYTLVIETDMVAANVIMQSKAKMRWEFKVLRSTPDYVEVELTLLDNTLLESNNDMLRDLATMSHAFAKMYSELHLILNHKGEILEILNMDLILDKWKQTKKEMEAAIAHSPEAKDVILLNDSIFQDKDKIKLAIEANEFFSIYFAYAYGKEFPYTIKDQIHNNFLNTASLQWKCKARTSDRLPSNAPTVSIDISSEPYGSLSSSWHKKAYGGFKEVMDVSKINTELTKKATYTIDTATGKIIEAVVKHSEIADQERLFNKMTYTLTSDHNTEKKPSPEEEMAYKDKKPKRRSFLIDEM